MLHGKRAVCLIAASAFFLSGCFGPFYMTRRLYDWNKGVGDKWENEIVFLVLALTPVYSIATLADAIVFNSMEFWTGDNPVAPGTALPRIKEQRLVRGEDEVLLSQSNGAGSSAMTMKFFREGELTQVLHMADAPGQPAVAKDASGNVLMVAQSMPDGGVVVRDAKGQTVATYTAKEAKRVRRTLP